MVGLHPIRYIHVVDYCFFIALGYVMKIPIYVILIFSFLCQSFGEDVKFYDLSADELDELISEAAPDVQYRNNGKAYLPRRQSPYTGWTAQFYKNGGIKWMTRFEDGEMKQVNNWDQDGDSRDGNTIFPQYVDYDSSGNVMGKVGISFKNKNKILWLVRNGKNNGPMRYLRFSGEIECEGFWKDGKQSGFWTNWHENGQKEMERTFKDGKQEGLSKSWYESGQQRAVSKFVEGKMMTQIRFKPNGDKCPVTNLKDGNGVVVTYNDDGTEDSRYTYKDGKEVE